MEDDEDAGASGIEALVATGALPAPLPDCITLGCSDAAEPVRLSGREFAPPVSVEVDDEFDAMRTSVGGCRAPGRSGARTCAASLAVR